MAPHLRGQSRKSGNRLLSLHHKGRASLASTSLLCYGRSGRAHSGEGGHGDAALPVLVSAPAAAASAPEPQREGTAVRALLTLPPPPPRAVAASAAAAAGGPERGAGGYEGDAEGEGSSGAFDRGMSEIARKVPLFEPARGDAAAVAGERPLPINLELWLYRAKVHTRKYEFADAEKLLNQVRSLRIVDISQRKQNKHAQKKCSHSLAN